MDIRLYDGDLFLSEGECEYISGIDEAAQRAMIACTVKKGSFLYDRSLGADTASCDRTRDDYERALQMAFREAIFKVPQTELFVKSVRKFNRATIACIEIKRREEKREIEVRMDGEL